MPPIQASNSTNLKLRFHRSRTNWSPSCRPSFLRIWTSHKIRMQSNPWPSSQTSNKNCSSSSSAKASLRAWRHCRTWPSNLISQRWSSQWAAPPCSRAPSPNKCHPISMGFNTTEQPASRTTILPIHTCWGRLHNPTSSLQTRNKWTWMELCHRLKIFKAMEWIILISINLQVPS